VRFAFIGAEKAAFPVRLLCRTLQVSRAGFYAWPTRPPARRAQADARLGPEVAAIHAETRQRYGSPRIHAELADRGCRTSRKRVARLDAGPRVGRPAPSAVPGDDAVAPSVSDRAQRLGATVRAGRARSSLGDRNWSCPALVEGELLSRSPPHPLAIARYPPGHELSLVPITTRRTARKATGLRRASCTRSNATA
jgi:hypothetical protein